MRTALLNLSPAALLLLASTGTALAASNAMITIEANIVTATCDVSVTDRLNLGNHTKGIFTVANSFIDTTAQSFDVRISNCEKPLAEGDTASLRISGSTLSGGGNNIFNPNNSSNIGVMVKNNGALLQSGDKILVGTAGTTPVIGDFEKSVPFSVALAAKNISAIANEIISVPITFSFIYN
ncbi:fimbrial protein [Serratia sp. (in: enterobacteria)]|uniref:fimbrial protein n=1 Tax=Serratia sp. (in: enterobacteria) TaxID=616 RepID=UPI0039896B80